MYISSQGKFDRLHQRYIFEGRVSGRGTFWNMTTRYVLGTISERRVWCSAHTVARGGTGTLWNMTTGYILGTIFEGRVWCSHSGGRRWSVGRLASNLQVMAWYCASCSIDLRNHHSHHLLQKYACDKNEKASHLYRGQTWIPLDLNTRFSQLQPMDGLISIHLSPPIILITIVFIIFTMVIITIARMGMIMICWHVGLQSPSHGWISRLPILQRDISASTHCALFYFNINFLLLLF